MAGSKGAKKENIDDLKQELDIDFHRITLDELYQRFQTHPENVSYYLYVHLNAFNITHNDNDITITSRNLSLFECNYFMCFELCS